MSRRISLLVVAVLVAALGTGLVYSYVHSANNRAVARQHPVEVLVAKSLIPAGTPVQTAVKNGQFELRTLPKSAVAGGSLSTTDTIQGEVALTDIYPGMQVVSQEFGASSSRTAVTIPPGDIAISLQLADPNRVAGFVVPGSHVVVFLTSAPGNSNGAVTSTTKVLLKDVEIIAVGTSTITPPPSGEANPESVSRALMTIAVNQRQAEQLIFAKTQGDLYFGLLNDQSKIATSDGGVNAGNLFH